MINQKIEEIKAVEIQRRELIFTEKFLQNTV